MLGRNMIVGEYAWITGFGGIDGIRWTDWNVIREDMLCLPEMWLLIITSDENDVKFFC